jgi:hypothetical protein
MGLGMRSFNSWLQNSSYRDQATCKCGICEPSLAVAEQAGKRIVTCIK